MTRMAKIKIGDAEHEVPDAVGAHLTATEARLAKLAADQQAAAEELGRLKATADAKARDEAEAQRRAAIAEAAKKGEVEKIQQLSEQRVKAIAERIRDERLRGLAAASQRLRRTGLDDAARRALIEDTVRGLQAAAVYDPETDRLTVSNNGVPVDAAAHLDAWLSARPWLCEPTTTPGSGAGPTGLATTPGQQTLQRAAFVKLDPQAQMEWIRKGHLVTD
jgi:hypothetical protein